MVKLIHNESTSDFDFFFLNLQVCIVQFMLEKVRFALSLLLKMICRNVTSFPRCNVAFIVK